MMRRLALASALFVAVGSAAPSMAVADTATTDIGISASVPNNCTISTSSVSFDTYDPIDVNAISGSALYGTGLVRTTCTRGASATITLSQGNNADNGSTDASPSRRLAAGANRLNYYLYRNSGRTTVWGNTTGTGLAPTADGTAQDSTVYGQIPAGQNVPAGSYSDTVTATVTY